MPICLKQTVIIHNLVHFEDKIKLKKECPSDFGEKHDPLTRHPSLAGVNREYHICITKTSFNVQYINIVYMLQLPIYYIIAQLIITAGEALLQYIYYNIIQNHWKTCRPYVL